MKQKLVWLLSATVLLSIVGCSNSNKETETVKTQTVKTQYGEVTLCDYKNLSAEKSMYTVTDEDVESEIKSTLAQYAEYNEVKRGAKSGDYIRINFTATSEGKTLLDLSEEEVEINLGAQEYGEEFDEALLGAKSGEKKEFTITYDSNYEDTDWAGKKIDFTVTVNAVEEEIIPECTEEFIKETLGYDSYDDMTAQVKESIASEDANNSSYEVRENLVQQVIEGSTIKSYTDELYENCEASIEANYSNYASFYGCESVQDFYDMLGITDKDIKSEVTDLVNRTVVLNAISEKEKLSVSDSEYQESLTRYAEEFGYESTEELLGEYDEESIRSWVLEDKALDLLEKNATITEKSATRSEE